MIEPENWKIALELYKGHSTSALLLAHQLIALKQCLRRGKKGIPDAISGLELAIDGLYVHSNFHKVGHKLYLRRLDGTLKLTQEEKLRQLGVKLSVLANLLKNIAGIFESFQRRSIKVCDCTQ